MSKSVLLKIWISVKSSGYKLCYGGLSNTPKPLRIVKGSWRIVKPEVDSRLSGVVILEVWETISYDMETHTRSQFARDLKKYSAWGLKMLSHRHESIRIERLDTTNDDPSYRMSICKTLRKYCLLLQIDIRYNGSSFAVTSRSIRVESCRIVNICYTLFWR